VREALEFARESSFGIRYDIGVNRKANPRQTQPLGPHLPGSEVGTGVATEGAEHDLRPVAELPCEERRIDPGREQDAERARSLPKGTKGLVERGIEALSKVGGSCCRETHRPWRHDLRMNPYRARGLRRTMAVAAVGGSGSPLVRRALFVDRDGTLNPDLRYLRDADRLELFRGVGNALSLAHDHGYLVICVTNQSGVERGFYSREDVERIHRRLNELLRPHRAQVDGFYYCPHAPETRCECRKPGTLLFRQARDEWKIDFATSAIVGDRDLDVDAGRELGLFTAVVTTPGHEDDPTHHLLRNRGGADVNAGSFSSAVLRILARG